MNNQNDSFVLYFRNKTFSEAESLFLHRISREFFSDKSFCKAHELVARNRISHDAKKILKAASTEKLKPFYFLVNMN